MSGGFRQCIQDIGSAISFEGVICKKLSRSDLEACAALKKSAYSKLLQKQKIRDMLERCTTTYGIEAVQTTRENDPISRLEATLRDIEAELEANVVEYIELVGHVQNAISQLTNPNEREVLNMKYIQGLKWDEIASIMHYNPRWCRELRDRGLRNLG